MSGVHAYRNALYALDKAGRVRIWRQTLFVGAVDENDKNVNLVIESGLVDGKLTRKDKKIKARGKKDPEQVGLMEANKNVKDKLNKEGYKTHDMLVQRAHDVNYPYALPDKIYTIMDKLVEYPTNENWHPLPMLAKKVDDKKIAGPLMIQRKYDGVRCLSTIDDAGRVIMVSRGGLYYQIPHIAEDLIRIFTQHDLHGKGIWLDGELYKHGIPFADISGAARTARSGGDLFEEKKSFLEYHVYDLLDTTNLFMPFRDRYYYLDQYVPSASSGSKTRLVETYAVRGMDDVKPYHEQFVEEGYEGTIIRYGDGVYEPGYRSVSLLKYKNFFEGEFTIVGMEYDPNDISTFRFLLETEDGQTFGCRPVGTHDLWQEYADNYLTKCDGKLATVRYLNLSVNGLPEKANVKAIRDYE